MGLSTKLKVTLIATAIVAGSTLGTVLLPNQAEAARATLKIGYTSKSACEKVRRTYKTTSWSTTGPCQAFKAYYPKSKTHGTIWGFYIRWRY